jgi:glucokinase
MAMSGRYTIGVDVGGTKIAYGLFFEGKLLQRQQHPVDKDTDGPRLCDTMIDAVHGLLAENQLELQHLAGIGIGMPSYILYSEGYILITSNLEHVRQFAMRDYIQNKLNISVEIDNDCNAAALAEYRHGAGKGSQHMLYCAVSTGIANGMIIHGELFRGSYGWAGESGHMLITPDEGVPCGCGNQGCFMSNSSGSMIVRHIQKRLLAGQPSILPELAGGAQKINCSHVIQAYHRQDELAVWAVEHMAHYLALWLYNLYQVLNINLYVFGGGLTHFGDALFDRVRDEFNRYNRIDQPVYFRLAELGDDSGIIGASEMVKDLQTREAL